MHVPGINIAVKVGQVVPIVPTGAVNATHAQHQAVPVVHGVGKFRVPVVFLTVRLTVRHAIQTDRVRDVRMVIAVAMDSVGGVGIVVGTAVAGIHTMSGAMSVAVLMDIVDSFVR